MKPTLLLAFITLAATVWSANAAPTDHSYYVTEMAPQLKFDVYNDGRNTYLESIPGLVVTGATADGERYIVAGVPEQIRGFMNGKPITVMRGVPPKPVPAVKPEPTKVNAELKRLKDELAELTSKMPSRVTTASTSGSPTSAAQAMPGARLAGPAAGDPAAKSPMVTSGASHTPPAGGTAAKYITASDVVVYQVTPGQHDLRSVIDNWSKLVGWKSVWDIDRDIPINMADSKENDFRSAVRRLLSATELGDLPAKPCFYSNNVVRVVRKTTKCNPNE